jgi:hypothetical protein
MKGFVHTLEEGVDVVMWQMNKGESKDSAAEFPLTSSHVTIKMQRKGDLMVQSALNFILRGGYLSKAIGRNRNGKCPSITGFDIVMLFLIVFAFSSQ